MRHYSDFLSAAAIQQTALLLNPICFVYVSPSLLLVLVPEFCVIVCRPPIGGLETSVIVALTLTLCKFPYTARSLWSAVFWSQWSTSHYAYIRHRSQIVTRDCPLRWRGLRFKHFIKEAGKDGLSVWLAQPVIWQLVWFYSREKLRSNTDWSSLRC